ncbi:unnamed protein product [Lathyrus oleraceus]
MSELYKVNLFKELSLARFRIFPYEKYESWRDEALWMIVRSCLYPHHPYPPNSNVLRAVVQKFLQAYEQDNELKSFDTSLRNEMIKVFAPLDNNLGQLQSPSLNQDGLGPLLSLKYYCNPDNQLLLENKGVFQHCNSMGDGESSISGGIVSVQAGPFDPKVESTFDLKRIATNYGFTMEELGALEHLFLENASYGNLFLKLGSDKEKFEFLSRQIDVFNRKYGGNDRRTAKRKVNPLTFPFSWFKDTLIMD